MVSNQKKGEEVNKIIENLNAMQNNEECSEALHKLLIDDCGGKLYKYMPIRDYTIPTIVNNTLHFSSPSVFNDPFDCKVGIDYLTLIEAKYLDEFDKITLYFGDFLSLRNGQKTIDEIPVEGLPIIYRWGNNKKLIDFLDATNGASFSEEEAQKIIFDHFDVVLEIISSLIDNAAGNIKLPITSSMFPIMLENITEDGKMKLVQNEGTYSDYIKELGIDIDADEIELTEKAYERMHPENSKAIEHAEKTFKTLEQKLNNSIYALFKVCCLCTSNKNKLMWSHYADGHKGICIEYDFSDLPANEMQPMPVFYTNTRPKFPWTAAINPSPETQSEATVHFMKALLTKDEAWEYENEWRLIKQSNLGIDDVAAPPIKCLYLGALCSDEIKESIKKVASELNIPIKQMKVDRGEYGLHASEI